MPANPRSRTHGMSLAERLAFWSNPDPDSDCILWAAALNNDGYGSVYWEGKCRKAHRMAWQAVHGPIPEGMCVCHRCDRPSCVNPDHLFLGTHRDNMHDMLKKGRRASTIGSKCPSALLTESVVRDILLDPRKQRDIAKAFGVSKSTVGAIKARVSWKHVTISDALREGT